MRILAQCNRCGLDFLPSELAAENTQLEGVKQLQFTKRRDNNYRSRTFHLRGGCTRIRVRRIGGNQKARIGVRFQYRARSCASSSAPLTAKTLSP
jgi:hypothetical protein